MWVYGKGHKGLSICVGGCVLREWVVEGGGLDGYFGEQGLASRTALKDFTDDALTISTGSLFQNGTARMVKANSFQKAIYYQLCQVTEDI